MPRIAQRQVHRLNAPATTPQGYYKRKLTIEFLDHALQQMNIRFQDDIFVCYKGLYVIHQFFWHRTMFGRMFLNFANIIDKISPIMPVKVQNCCFGATLEDER